MMSHSDFFRFGRLTMDIGTSFWVQGLTYLVGILLIYLAGVVLLPRKAGLSIPMGLGLSLIAGAAVLFLFTLVALKFTGSDRHMGGIILLLYPIIDALLAIAGALILIVYGIVRAARGGKRLPGGRGPGAAPAGAVAEASAGPEAAAGPAPDEAAASDCAGRS